MRLNVAEIQPITENLGPGKRFALWVQGCPFNCKNCISPYWIPFEVNKPTLVEELAQQILEATQIQGITISGGEPFMQAQQLTSLLKLIKEHRPDFDVIIFTGFKLKRLNWKEAQSLLYYTDVLIDGLYVEDLNDNKGLRGSSNQVVHFLSSALLRHKDYFDNRARTLEYHPLPDGELIVGVPEKIS